MTTHHYTQEYFKNMTERAAIKSALTEAIPQGVAYFNLILALTEMIAEWSKLAFADEVMHYPDVKP